MGKNNAGENVESIKMEIAQSGKNYLALSPIPALKVHCNFAGKLADIEVLWDATVQTLASYLQESLEKNALAEVSRKRKDVQRSEKPLSFMEVSAPQNGVSKLKVVLPVPLIDEPTIKKTIIMIRCYKRLKVGYHEFGGNL